MRVPGERPLVTLILVALGAYLWLSLALRDHPAAAGAGVERVAMMVAGAVALVGAGLLVTRRGRR